MATLEEVMDNTLVEDTVVESEEYTKEMKDFFDKRTSEHIERVKKNARVIEEAFPTDYAGLVQETKTHDKTKYQKVELDPYYFLFYEFCGVIVSSNTKVYDNIYWKNIECVSYAEATKTPNSVFNLITEKGIIKCKNNYFLDYSEKKHYGIVDEVNKLLDIGFATYRTSKSII